MPHEHTLPVIDAHTHVHPALGDSLVRLMDENGLAQVVSLGILESLDIPFAEGMAAYRAALGSRLVYFPTVDFRDNAPGFGERMAEGLRRKIEAGAAGLKIFKELGLRHKDAAGRLIPVDDPRLDPIWAVAGELGVPVLIHTADPVAFFQPLDERNERLDELTRYPDWHFGGPEFPRHAELMAQLNRVVGRHPGTNFIAAHVGSYAEDLAYVDGCLDRYPNYYVDTAARVGEIGRHPADESRAFFLKHQDRILFGTDMVLGWDAFPPLEEADLAAARRLFDAHWRFFETPARQMEYPGYPLQGRWKVDGLDLPAEVLAKLYGGNARRLIPALAG